MSATIPTRLLPQTVTIQPYLGTGAYGDTFGPAVTVPARVDRTRKLIESAAGQQVVSEATVIVQPGTVEYPIKSKITLPGESAARSVVSSPPKIGARGVHHLELNT